MSICYRSWRKTLRTLSSVWSICIMASMRYCGLCNACPAEGSRFGVLFYLAWTHFWVLKSGLIRLSFLFFICLEAHTPAGLSRSAPNTGLHFLVIEPGSDRLPERKNAHVQLFRPPLSRFHQITQFSTVLVARPSLELSVNAGHQQSKPNTPLHLLFHNRNCSGFLCALTDYDT